VFAKQPPIDQRRQMLTSLGGQFKAVRDRIASRIVSASCKRRAEGKPAKKREQGTSPASKKKEQGASPAQNCVDPISPKMWI
jgi:hypothetical protein